ncbi:TraB/VirB10 family protein [Hydrogenovibrio marinus]|uniref:Conjugal transfer protein TraB n=1 Tax=Hydrogenovibrio marinus TaxID=28885 RepID=A0A066ZLQ4_HYDMR|nr:TraB/VirB10 family protein [Hydrogenovibrio marinus]KDN94728.1 hypothetical protein EI16_12595 [Hydrogenovibrio marinus]
MANPNDETRKKQKKLYWVIIGSFVGLVFVVGYMKQHSASEESASFPHASHDTVTERYSALGSNVDGKDIWMAKSSNEIDDLKNENKDLKGTIKNLKRDIPKQIQEAVNKSKADIQKQIAQQQQKAEQERRKQQQEQQQQALKQNTFRQEGEKFTHPTNANPNSAPFTQAGTDKKGIVITNRFYKNPNAKNIGAYNGQDLTPPVHEGLVSVSFDNADESTSVKAGQDSQQNAITQKDSGKTDDVPHTIENTVPAGSFAQAILLGGVDAATGGQAQNDPDAVLLEVTSDAFLPNKQRFPLKGCRIIGSAYGDINSERAKIRVQKLTCVDENNVVHEINAKGVAFGEDGRNGGRGTVVTKQGQLITNSILAGIASGMGTAFQSQASTLSTNALGSLTTVNPNQMGQAALGAAGKDTGDTLKKYYIKIAEKMFPVIEVSPGRKFDIVFTKGFTFDDQPAIQDGDGESKIDQMVSKSKAITDKAQTILGMK